MITKFRVKNYKSLRDVEIDFAKFNVLIGPNASGKSNLLDSLAFLSEASQTPLNNLYQARGGYGHLVFGGKEEENIEMSVDFLLNGLLSNYFICFSGQGVVLERLGVGGKVVMERGEVDGTILGLDMTYRKVSRRGAYTTVIRDCKAETGFSLDFYKSVEYLSLWKLYQFLTSEMRSTFPARKALDLDRDGRNLAQVLISLYTERPKVFRKIEEVLKQGIPEIDELLTPLDKDGNTYTAIRQKGLQQALDYYQISDGTFKLLAYITAIVLWESRLVCFEEPENFVHPRLLQLLVEILKKSEKQIILSTHSPYLVDLVEPEDVLVVEKKEIETLVSRIEEPERLREVLTELGLGEMWYSGEIGGVP